MEDFAQALEKYDYDFQNGQIVRGTVIQHEPEGIYVDIGAKAAAFLPIREVTLEPVADLAERLPLGEEREFLIIRDQNADGQLTLSIRELEIQRQWDLVTELQASGQVVQVRVTGLNKGGVTVDVEGLRGFIPRSHLIQREDLEALQGENLMVSFLEVDRDRKRVVLSQRIPAQTKRFSQVEVGQLVTGKVVNIKPFGVFVDLEGMTGLLHINQISHKYVKVLADLFSLGQAIQALIVDMDEGKSRVSLSTKVLENYPGEMLEQGSEVMASAAERGERARKQLQA